MATATMELEIKINPSRIENALDAIGLREKAEELWDILYEMEVDRELELSWEEAMEGKTTPIKEAITANRKRVLNEFIIQVAEQNSMNEAFLFFYIPSHGNS